MSECEEVADNLPLPTRGKTMDDCRQLVRSYMPDESVVVIDNVAEALHRRANAEEPYTDFYIVDADEWKRVHDIATALLNGTDRMRDFGNMLWLVVREVEKRGKGP